MEYDIESAHEGKGTLDYLVTRLYGYDQLNLVKGRAVVGVVVSPEYYHQLLACQKIVQDKQKGVVEGD